MNAIKKCGKLGDGLMKINIFAENSEGGLRAARVAKSDIFGSGNWQTTLDFEPDSDAMMASLIDKSRLSPMQRLAQDFLQFLAEKDLSIAGASALPAKERKALKEEFLGRD